MRRLLCAGVVLFGMLTGCGGSERAEPTETLDTMEQGLACAWPDMSCPGSTICVDNGMCRMACPPSGVCNNGGACRVSPGGTSYCQ